MLTLLIAAAAAASPALPPTQVVAPQVTSQAQASVRIVHATRISFDHPADLTEAQVHPASVQVDGTMQQLQLIEFQ